MELNAVQTRIFSKPKESNVSAEPDHDLGKPTSLPAITPETALEILKSKPNHDELTKVLHWLLKTRRISPPPSSTTTRTSNISDLKVSDLKSSGPLTGQITNVLVTDTLPAFWLPAGNDLASNEQFSKLCPLLLKCLRSVPGLRALTNNLRQQLDHFRDPKSARNPNNPPKRAQQRLTLLIEVLEGVLKGDGVLAGIWREINVAATTDYDSTHSNSAVDLRAVKGEIQTVSLMWNDLLALLKGGKLVSAIAEADRITPGLGRDKCSWIGDGEKYGDWLGRNVWFMALRGGDKEVEAAASVLGNGLTLGYKDAVVKAAFADLYAGGEEAADKSERLVGCLTNQAQRIVLYATVRMMDNRYLSLKSRQRKYSGEDLVGAVATLLSTIIGEDAIRKTIMIDWLVAVSPEAVRQSHLAHRAVVLLLSADTKSLTTALTRALELFTQQLFIKHTPIFQQEINAQILLLLSGYVSRADKEALVRISKSSVYLNAISNHLASTSPRAHFLGMVVGTAVSDLVDSKDKRMNFGSEEMNGRDGEWYRNLTNVQDSFGSIKDLSRASSLEKPSKLKQTSAITPTSQKTAKLGVPVKGSSKIIAIEELNDTTSEEDDIPTYAKPDTDPEDSDDNGEIIQKKKPLAPAYIKDLLVGLRNLEDYDNHRLALSTAFSLIRRKASFGTEVTDNIDDLASLLTGLNDRYDMDSFQRWRLQGMIALLVAYPKRMGPWFAQAFYNGEYSISQRASILTTLGLGAREIAGLGKEDEAMTGSSTEPQFPTKQLPANFHNHYMGNSAPSSSTSVAPNRTLPSSSPTPIDTLSTNLSQELLHPLAAQAADNLTGPDALKIRTFSSRLAVRSRTAAPSSNALAKIVADTFIFPLIGRWSSTNIITSQPTSPGTTTTSPFLLSHLLRTLALILHASGTTTPELPRLTSEFWHLLLSVRSPAMELPVLEALLFALLTLLEVNIARGDRRVAEEHSRELLETQAWVEGLFETRIGSGASEEDERVRMVAAGVLVRCREVVEKWQRLLMGDLVGYK